jgi:hypothetical protein
MVTEEMRRLHNNELNDLYSSPNTIPVTKSSMRWTGNVECMGKRGAYWVLVGGNLRQKHHWETQT